MFEQIKMHVDAALMECASHAFIQHFKQHGYAVALEAVRQDFQAFLEKDPACFKNARLLMQYTSFRAVLHHRIAHQIVRDGLNLEVAFALASRGKCLSGAEIHPCARIGARFILDHGVGTVIGESTEIGDDCYILGGVVLGANGIAANPRAKRHPSLGNHVQVGTNAKVLGPVTIGNHVFIGAGCLVTDNIESHHRVVLCATQQVVKTSSPAKLLAMMSA